VEVSVEPNETVPVAKLHVDRVDPDTEAPPGAGDRLFAREAQSSQIPNRLLVDGNEEPIRGQELAQLGGLDETAEVLDLSREVVRADDRSRSLGAAAGEDREKGECNQSHLQSRWATARCSRVISDGVGGAPP